MGAAFAQHPFQNFWRDTVIRNLPANPNTQMTVSYSSSIDTSYFKRIFYISEFGMASVDEYAYMKVTDDSLFLIDMETGNISYGSRHVPESVGKKHKYVFNLYYNIRDRYWQEINDYAWFYFRPTQKDSIRPVFQEKMDTLTNGRKYTRLKWHRLWGYYIIEENGKEKEVPYFRDISYFYNPITHLIERITVEEEGRPTKYFDFSEIRGTSNTNFPDTLFDIRNPRYRDYAIYNFQTDPAPSEMGIVVDNITMDDSTRFCRLHTTEGKTIILNDCDEWKLLDLWHFNCKACRMFHQQLKKEQDSLGYRMLEQEGIRLFCINYQAGMTEYLRKYAKQLGLSDIIYASRDIGRHLSIPYFPYYYLFSPSGDLVFRGGLDYNAILEAKQLYEKKPKKQIRRAVKCEKSIY